MHCHSCGNETDQPGLYCPECGARQADSGSQEISSPPRMIIKPFTTPVTALFSIIPLQLFFTIWGSVVFGIAGYFFIQYFELRINPWVPALVFGVLFFILTPVFAVYMTLNRYAKTEYRFLDTRLEYIEGYFGSRIQSIGYEHIIEINLLTGPRQRLFQLGTVDLSIASATDPVMRWKNGIRIRDIRYPHEAYVKIKNIIDGFRRSS